jgi:hypothetical protein
MAAGNTIKRYKTVAHDLAEQVAEGEEIKATKVERKELDPLVIDIKKYRKDTTAEAIQKVGYSIAVDNTDDALISAVQNEKKKEFFSLITNTSGSTTAKGGATVQAAVASAWTSIQKVYEDIGATPVFFINPEDVGDYLANASITMQTAFGLSYFENFLGLGNMFVTSQVPAGTIYATATENLNCAYVAQGGDVANALGLTYDESGVVGMKHSLIDSRASVMTLVVTGVLFYAESAEGIVTSAITKG